MEQVEEEYEESSQSEQESLDDGSDNELPAFSNSDVEDSEVEGKNGSDSEEDSLMDEEN